MDKNMRKPVILTSVLLLAATVPALISDLTIRLVTAGCVFFAAVAAICLLGGKIFGSRQDIAVEPLCRANAPGADMTPVAEFLDRNSQMIPVLINQLDSVIQETEDAVVEIGERFLGIVSQARSQASRAANAFGEFADGGEEDGTTLIALSREALTAVIGNLKSVSGVARHTLSGMQKITETMSSIREVVSEIEYIADQTNLLALNASIEAARAGEYGRGFAVVADEVRKLSSRSTSAASDIGKLIRTIESDISGIYGETEKSYEKAEQRSTESELIMNDTLGRLNDVMTRVRGELDILSSETESLAGDISGIVVSMQFQDITRQRIEHVIDPLRAIKTECENMSLQLHDSAAGVGENGSSDRLTWLENMYTMESERQVMRETLAG